MTRVFRMWTLLLAVLGAVVLWHIATRPSRGGLRVRTRIETVLRDPRAWLGYVTVGPDGVVYALERANGNYFYSAHTRQGNLIWRVRDRANRNGGDVFVAFAGPRQSHLGWYTGSKSDWQVGGHRWVTVSKDGAISCVPLKQASGYRVQFVHASPSADGLYLVGSSDEANMIAAKFNVRGEECWIRFEAFQGWYDRAVVDARGDLIAAGEPAGAIATRIVKYSPEGGRLWVRDIRADDGAATVWLGTGKHRTVLALVRLHDIVWLKDKAEVDRYIRLGSKSITGSGAGEADESGRGQDYVLMTYDRRGNLLSRRVLSHGAQLLLEDAEVSSKGDVYLVGNRQKLNRNGFPAGRDGAELIKCGSAGTVIWSRRIELPAGCLVKGITLDDRGGIYIYGDTGGYKGRRATTQSRLFIYRVTAPG